MWTLQSVHSCKPFPILLSPFGQSIIHVSSLFFVPIYRCGTNEYIISRPDLYNLLLKQIPPEYIHMGKKVLWFNQDEDGVTIRTWDKKYHHGDILVGADGSYSAVRQNMYKSLKDKGLLPPSDDTTMPFDYVCLIGQTEVLDQEDFPELNKPYSKFNSTLGIERSYVVSGLAIIILKVIQETQMNSMQNFAHVSTFSTPFLVCYNDNKTKQNMLGRNPESEQIVCQGQRLIPCVRVGSRSCSGNVQGSSKLQNSWRQRWQRFDAGSAHRQDAQGANLQGHAGRKTIRHLVRWPNCAHGRW